MRSFVFVLVWALPAAAGEFATRVEDSQRHLGTLARALDMAGVATEQQATDHVQAVLYDLEVRLEETSAPAQRSVLEQRIARFERILDDLFFLCMERSHMNEASFEYFLSTLPWVYKQEPSYVEMLREWEWDVSGEYYLIRALHKLDWNYALTEDCLRLFRSLPETDLDPDDRLALNALYDSFLNNQEHTLAWHRYLVREQIPRYGCPTGEPVRVPRATWDALECCQRASQCAPLTLRLTQQRVDALHDSNANLRRDLYVPPLPEPCSLTEALDTLPHCDWRWASPPLLPLPHVTWPGGRLEDALDVWCRNTGTAWEFDDEVIILRHAETTITASGLALTDLATDRFGCLQGGDVVSLRIRRYSPEDTPLGPTDTLLHTVPPEATSPLDLALCELRSSRRRVISPDGSYLLIEVLGLDPFPHPLDAHLAPGWEVFGAREVTVHVSGVPLQQVLTELTRRSGCRFDTTPDITDLPVDLDLTASVHEQIATLCATYSLEATWFYRHLLLHPPVAKPRRTTLPRDPKTLLPTDAARRLQEYAWLSSEYDDTVGRALNTVARATGISLFVAGSLRAVPIDPRCLPTTAAGVLDGIAYRVGTSWILDERIPAIFVGVDPEDLPEVTPLDGLPASLVQFGIHPVSRNFEDAIDALLSSLRGAPHLYVEDDVSLRYSDWCLQDLPLARTLDLWCWEQDLRWRLDIGAVVVSHRE